MLGLQTPNAFTKLTGSADDKVGGLSLNRFGGFLKQSWRMNDWTWGRVDASTMLLRVLLSPQRVRRFAGLTDRCTQSKEQAEQAAGRFVDELTSLVFQSLPGHLVEAREDAIEELAPLFLAGPTHSMPASLPRTADLVAWPQHMLIALDELPVIARAVQADGHDRANPRSRGELFLRQYATRRPGCSTYRHSHRPGQRRCVAEGGGGALITVAVIAALIAGLMVLGSIPAPVKSPPATIAALRRAGW